jgi:hypothetical protein
MRVRGRPCQLVAGAFGIALKKSTQPIRITTAMTLLAAAANAGGAKANLPPLGPQLFSQQPQISRPN